MTHLYNKHMFNLIYIYICIPVSGCVGRSPGDLIWPGAITLLRRPWDRWRLKLSKWTKIAEQSSGHDRRVGASPRKRSESGEWVVALLKLSSQTRIICSLTTRDLTHIFCFPVQISTMSKCYPKKVGKAHAPLPSVPTPISQHGSALSQALSNN